MCEVGQNVENFEKKKKKKEKESKKKENFAKRISGD